MNELGIAKELMPRLQSIAAARGLATVRRIELMVGILHQASAKELIAGFEKVFHGTSFDGAEVIILITRAGQEIVPPNSDQPVQANGWEVLISLMEGDE